MDVIDALTSVLESKSKTLLRPKSSLAASLFILNNLSEVEKRVRADRMLQNVIGSIGAAEKERDQSKRGSRTSTGSNPAASAFSMPKSFEKAKRAGLDGKNTPCRLDCTL
jgi:Exo70 exocyst complex subunit